ncbi:4Fe-4S dicluster domain-containing protein [uncultured Desulfosarcina sp.]|uniref:4Fe-4S dicluster domain-containing protein n=1 Tax=uncultured Desulfosarcina sp. TaxID=218289 RepID=UPI0029C86974|nr:4Fe-4S binding protein [uncultured Desulfosarcina sp.]
MLDTQDRSEMAVTMAELHPQPLKGKSPRRPPVILFDPTRCTGCGECETACANRRPLDGTPAIAAIRVLKREQDGENFAIYCQHCREPLCIAVCPVHAITKGDDGIVRIDRRLCTDCGLCALACPESAPLKDPETGRIAKCDLCDGEDPACVKQCPEKALILTRGKRFGWIKLLRWPVQALAFFLLVMVFIGTFCYFRAGSVSLECPAGFLQHLAASKTLWLTGLGSAAVLMGLTLLLGRFFCGWICPFGFLLDLVGKITPKFGLPRFIKNRMIKYGVLAGAVGTSAGLGFQPFCTVCPIGSLCRSYGPNGLLTGAQMAIFPAVAALEVGERRSWCRYFCPVGAVLALAARIGLIKIVIGARQCKKFSCMRCADICPTGIIDREALREGISPKIPMAECIMCLRCVDQCPYGAAKIRFRWQKTAPGDKVISKVPHQTFEKEVQS